MKYITVEHETDTAHRLTFHKGKCKSVHGHRYKFVVSIEVKDDFVDFYTLKSYIRQKLDHFFDHAIILHDSLLNAPLGSLLINEGNKVNFMPNEPTVENMVDFVWDMLTKPEEHEGEIVNGFMSNLCQLTIYETPTNYCTRRNK